MSLWHFFYDFLKNYEWIFFFEKRPVEMNVEFQFSFEKFFHRILKFISSYRSLDYYNLTTSYWQISFHIQGVRQEDVKTCNLHLSQKKCHMKKLYILKVEGINKCFKGFWIKNISEQAIVNWANCYAHFLTKFKVNGAILPSWWKYSK